MPPAAQNYSITELELSGLTINIASFKHLLTHRAFDAVTDHSALTYIMKSKTETASNRIKRLLEILSNYCFYLYYIKGRDMKLSDFLSRVKLEDNNPNEVIPISFCLHDMVNEELYIELIDCYNILHDNYYSIHDQSILRYNVGTRSSTKAKGEILPPVHGVQKHLDPHKKPEQQIVPKVVKTQPMVQTKSQTSSDVQTTKKKPQIKRRIGQGRAGARRKIAPKQSVSVPKIPRIVPKITTPNELLPQKVTEKVEIPQPVTLPEIHQPRTIPVKYPDRYERSSYIDPLVRPQPKPYGQKNVRPSPESIDPEQTFDVGYIEHEVRNDIEENSPYQERPHEETIARPTEKDLVIPPSLESQIKKELLVHKYLPKHIALER